MVAFRRLGSPRIKLTDLSFGDGSGASTELVAANESESLMNEQQVDLNVNDIDAERLKDRSAHEKFLKINVRHITDGQGVVAGVLLVTPNTVMFDPNVSDPLVIEHGAEAYGVIAPVDFVVNAALYPDIAHMRVADSKITEQPAADPIYFPTNCPLHRKYALLKEKAKERVVEEELDPAAGLIALAGCYEPAVYCKINVALSSRNLICTQRRRGDQ